MFTSPHPPAADFPASPYPESAFLKSLGDRVRALRKTRSLTRKLLSQRANVSVRHLAQLESGEGNVSVVLLRRIASALGVSLAELFTVEQPPPTQAPSRNRIALIGLRGAGKSTLGAKLATSLDVPFIELDREIEKDTGMPLGDIFSLYGQSGYRAIERRTLERVMNQFDRGVFSIGGGVVSEQETYDFLRSHCRTVWIKAKPEEHMARVMAQGDFRAMAGNDRAMEDLRQLLSAREPFYRKADTVLDTSNSSVEDSFTRLKSSLGVEPQPSLSGDSRG
jgi:XRE family transcriptional regulator, aerobic/anaerobic benzoate catabolism transcriptional regulator